MRIFGFTEFVVPLPVRRASIPFDTILKNPCFTRLALGARNTFNWPKKAGVYVIRCKPEGPAIYVGMTGRVGKTGRLITKSGLNTRVYRWTPYYFDTKEGYFRYAPRCSSSSSKKECLKLGYASQIALKDLQIDCFTIGVKDRIAPAAIEAHLLQAHLDQYGCLPKANRQF